VTALNAQSVVLGAEDSIRLVVSPFGARITSIGIAGPRGPMEVCLAYPGGAAPAHDPWYVGTVLGRYAGRIAAGRLGRGGQQWRLARASGERHCLHGGPGGFHARDWQVKEYAADRRLVLDLQSPHGDQGFPGALHAEVTFELMGDTGFALEVRATCDAPTVVNLAHHAYFNLDGGPPGSVLEHELKLHATHYTPVDSEGIPTGAIETVAGSPFDFRDPRRIGDVAGAGRRLPHGLDQNVIIDGPVGLLRPAAVLRSPRSGVQLTVSTTQPGMQIYSGGFLRVPFTRFGGICFESQNFPDAPNQPAFPDPWLLPGAVYRHRTEFSFQTDP
jgi:aldose 1-epimerase